MSVSQDRFRRVLGHLAGGVALVTARGPAGEPCGLTATSVCSVSLDPPLVLASVDQAANTHLAIQAAGAYAINLLDRDQERLAVRFSRDDPEKFRGLEVREGAAGSPVLRAALAHLDCTVVREVEAGDHTLFIGRVEAGGVRDEGGEPLVHHLGRYGTLSGPGSA